jgi:hypothetical protein
MRPILLRNYTLRDWRRPGVVEEPRNEDAHDQTRCRAKNKQAGKSRRDKGEYCQKPNSGTLHVGSLSPPNLLLVRYFAVNPSFRACLNLAHRVISLRCGFSSLSAHSGLWQTALQIYGFTAWKPVAPASLIFLTHTHPTGRLSARRANQGHVCPSPFAKIFPFSFHPNHFYIRHRPVPQRGGSRSSRTRDRMRWTQAALKTRALTCGRRSRVVLTPRRWRQVLEKQASQG